VRQYATAITLVGTLLLVSGKASACRTTTCDRQDAPLSSCPPTDTCNTAGTPIFWPSTCVSTSVSAKGSELRHIAADDVDGVKGMRSIVQDAFNQWTFVDCGNGSHPNFEVVTFPDVYCTDVTGDSGYKPAGPNYNVWIFRDYDWPYDNVGDEGAIAITTTQFSPTTGEIFDSDVEFNSWGNIFTIGLALPALDEMDLPSVIQHESGHFLGLAHSQLDTATMFASLSNGDSTRRTLEQDDVDSICAAYPPGKLNPTCDPEPRHGFSTECEFEKGCCTVAPGRSTGRHGSWGALLVGLCLTAGVYRRKNRGSPKRNG